MAVSNEGTVELDQAELEKIGSRLQERMKTRRWLERHCRKIFELPLAKGRDYVLATSCDRNTLQFFPDKPTLTMHMAGLDKSVQEIAVYKYRRSSEVIYML